MEVGCDRLSLECFWLLVKVWIKRTENFGEVKPECLCRVYGLVIVVTCWGGG